MANTSRRAVLSAGAMSALAAIAATAVAKPSAAPQQAQLVSAADAVVLALASQFMTLQLQVDAINAGRPHTEEELDTIVTTQAAIMDEMNEHIVTTMKGHQARARVVAAWYQMHGLDDCPHEIDEYRVWPLFRDLIGGLI